MAQGEQGMARPLSPKHLPAPRWSKTLTEETTMNYRDLAHRIQQLQPGQRIEVSGHVLRDMEPRGVFAIFRTETAADSVLENIVGSSYEFWYEENPMTGNTTFGRLKTPLSDGRRTYVSPDRRHHYQREGRLYRPVNASTLAHEPEGGRG